MKIYQWSKIYTRYDKSINCEQQTHIFFLGNCYGRKMSHSIKTDVRICEAWIHMRHLNEEQKGVDFHKKNIAGIHHKIPWLFPDFLPFKDFPWLFTEFPDFSLTLKNKNFPWLFPDRWQPCVLSQNFLPAMPKMRRDNQTSQNVVFCLVLYWPIVPIYPQTSNISFTLEGNKRVDHSDVVGVSPVGTAPTTSSFLT